MDIHTRPQNHVLIIKDHLFSETFAHQKAHLRIPRLRNNNISWETGCPIQS